MKPRLAKAETIRSQISLVCLGRINGYILGESNLNTPLHCLYFSLAFTVFLPGSVTKWNWIIPLRERQ